MFSNIADGSNEKMLTSNYLDSITKKCEFLYKLILEAEKSRDQDQMVKLYEIARSETENLSKSLRQYLSRNGQDDQLDAA